MNPKIVDYLSGKRMSYLDFPGEEMQLLKDAVRADGRCGSMQTFEGLPCRKRTPEGYTVCWRHGSRAPQTINKAERLLAFARMPALEALVDMIEQFRSEVCPTCGYPKGDTEEKRLIERTARTIFDRAGLGPKATIDVKTTTRDDLGFEVSQLTPDEGEQLDGLLSAMETFKTRVNARLNGIPDIEGEVVRETLALPATAGAASTPRAADVALDGAIGVLQGRILRD